MFGPKGGPEMPWKETDVMNERTEFVLRVMRGLESFGELCREYGISRKTGYKWKKRFMEEGLDGLADQSRRPHASPNELDEDTVCRIVKLKHAHPSWGPAKLREVLARSDGKGEVPSVSTFKRVLDKAGLVRHRRRRKPPEQGRRVENRVKAERPNQVWTVDFKGWWYTRDRSRFEPLTIRDDFSRYVLCAQATADARTETVRAQFDRVFQKHGLPEIIRSDNGSPFAASRSPLGLSRLSAWWLTMGIDLDRIQPGRPDQNGGHERMHRDIAFELERFAAIDWATQQASLDTWRRTFNHERPHEAIGMRVPGDLYHPSPRRYEPEEVELCYPQSNLTRRVQSKGYIRVQGQRILISTALGGYHVGLRHHGGDRLSVQFCRLCLGEIDLSVAKFYPATTN
jgi:transposase InsO family protein